MESILTQIRYTKKAVHKEIGRFHLLTGHEGPQGEQKYSSTLLLTSALEGDEGSASCPGSTLSPGKTRYPLYRMLGGLQGRSGQVPKISPPPGFDPRTNQPIGSRYNDYTTRPTEHGLTFIKFPRYKIRFCRTTLMNITPQLNICWYQLQLSRDDRRLAYFGHQACTFESW